MAAVGGDVGIFEKYDCASIVPRWTRHGYVHVTSE